MNDQNSPTADGQGPGSSPWRNPLEEPQSVPAAPGAPKPYPGGPAGSGGPAGYGGGPAGSAAPGGFGASAAAPRRSVRALLTAWKPDLLVVAVLVVAGAALGVVAGLAWYRFAPTVWLTLPANAVSQVTSGVDQSALLVEPEAKGIASVDGYFFVFTAIAGVLLGVFGFFLARRGFLGGRDRAGDRDGAAVGAWAGVLLGGLAASTVAAALGRWVSMPDPLTVLHKIAAGHAFHAPVALHAQGLYVAAPLLGMVLFLALTLGYTKPSPPPWQGYGEQGYFTAQNPYGLRPADAGQPPVPPEQSGQAAGPEAGPDAGSGASSGASQADSASG